MRLLLTIGLLIPLAAPAFAQSTVQQQSQRWHCQDHPDAAYQIEEKGLSEDENQRWTQASDDYSQAVIVRDYCASVTTGHMQAWHLLTEAIDLSGLALAVKEGHKGPYQPFLNRALY